MSFQSDLNDLSNLDNVTLELDATVSSGHSAKNIFCNGWPAAKSVLESIAAIIKNPVVKIVIGIIIKAGDALSNKICTE